jgi:hypothetical protein
MTIVPPCLDVVVRKLSFDHCDSLVRLYPQMPNASPCEAPLPELSGKKVVVVPDAQSTPNEVEISRPVRGACGASNPVLSPRIIIVSVFNTLFICIINSFDGTLM